MKPVQYLPVDFRDWFRITTRQRYRLQGCPIHIHIWRVNERIYTPTFAVQWFRWVYLYVFFLADVCFFSTFAISEESSERLLTCLTIEFVQPLCLTLFFFSFFKYYVCVDWYRYKYLFSTLSSFRYIVRIFCFSLISYSFHYAVGMQHCFPITDSVKKLAV